MPAATARSAPAGRRRHARRAAPPPLRGGSFANVHRPTYPGTAASRFPAFFFAPFVFCFGVLVLACSPLVMLVTDSAAGVRKAVYTVVGHVVIAPLRWFLDTVCTYLIVIWWFPARGTISQDGRPVLEGCAVGELQYYGAGAREYLQAVHPVQPQPPTRGAARRTAAARPEAEAAPGDSPGSGAEPLSSPDCAAARTGGGGGALRLLLSLGGEVSSVARARLAAEGVATEEDLLRCSAADLDALGLRIGDRNRVLARAASRSARCWSCGVGLAATQHVVYIHGGGFIAANATLLMGSVTPVARAGFTVWCVTYPLAPVYPFPHAVVAVLRALAYIRGTHGVEQLSILGDSAGGGLATMAAGLLWNPGLLTDLARTLPAELRADAKLHRWGYPAVTGVCSLYGVLDTCSWLDPPAAKARPLTPLAALSPGPGQSASVRRVAHLSRFENRLSAFALDFVLWCYDGGGGPLAGRQFLCDILPFCEAYPPTLLIAGTVDTLYYSSMRAEKELRRKGVPVRFLQYKARHAFFGFPPQLRRLRHPCDATRRAAWTAHAQPATDEVIAFLRDPERYCAAPPAAAAAAAGAAF